MADSCKVKTPNSNVKKTQEGSGKKRRKHKKSADTSGDGTPSTKSVNVKLNPSQASTSQTQTKLEGATSSINGVAGSPQSSNKASKQENNVVKVNEPVEKLLSNTIDNDRKTGGVPVLCAESKICEQHVKEEIKVAEPVDNKVKQENKSKMDDDNSKKSAPQKTGPDTKDNELSATGLHIVKEKKVLEAAGKGDDQQKGIVHEKSEQNPKEKAKSEKVPLLTDKDLHQKASVKVNAETRKTSDLGAEQRQQAKGEHDKRTEVGGGEQKSKAQLRAERRAVQEAQRAAKDTRKSEAGTNSLGGAANSPSVATVKKEHVGDKSKPAADLAGGEKNRKKSTSETGGEKNRKKSASETGGEENRKKAAGELTSGEKNRKKTVEKNAVIQGETEEQIWLRREDEILHKSLKIDNSVMNLGFQYFHHNIVGANARCMALLSTLKEVIAKYKTPEEKELSRDLEKNCLNPCISYINYCRPISTSMGNAIRHLKYHINNIPSDMKDETAISKLLEVIDNFIEVNMIKASEGVASNAFCKIDNGDVILVYAASSLIGQVLKKSFKAGKKFRVIVVEGRPRSEGKAMLRYLVRCGIPCSYVYIGSASHAMSEATKVFLGAAAMFAIGDMYSRSGNSMIAALAKANNIPVLVCCETYKFTDKVQLHTGDSNLHTQGKDLVSIGHRTPILANWEDISLGLLNLMYDVTGSEYITAVVTELGMLPCTSVPVVLRRQEDLYSLN